MYYNAVTQYKYWGSLVHQNDSFNWQIYTRTGTLVASTAQEGLIRVVSDAKESA